MLRVSQVQGGRLELRPLHELLQVDLSWLDEPEVLILMGGLLVDERHRGGVAIRFLRHKFLSGFGFGDLP